MRNLSKTGHIFVDRTNSNVASRRTSTMMRDYDYTPHSKKGSIWSKRNIITIYEQNNTSQNISDLLKINMKKRILIGKDDILG